MTCLKSLPYTEDVRDNADDILLILGIKTIIAQNQNHIQPYEKKKKNKSVI